jgi:parallel beta-helix repeat protein
VGAYRLSRCRRTVVAVTIGVFMVGTMGVSGTSAASGTLWLTKSLTLKADHNGNIMIQADNVTLDCAGHTVYGPGDGAYSGGIDIHASNVTVKRCTVSGFVNNGLFGGGAGLRVEQNVFVKNTNHGAHVTGTLGGLVANNTSRSNGALGIVVTESSNMILSGNTAKGQLWGGFGLMSGTTATTVVGNTASGNGVGFIVDGVSGNTIRDNASIANQQGFLLTRSNGSRVEGNTASGNQLGFLVEDSVDAALSQNTANNNGVGFVVSGSSQTALDENHSNSNTEGFVVEGASEGTLLSSNIAAANTNTGYFIRGNATGTFLTDNSSQANYWGYWISEASDSTLAHNSAVNNRAIGFTWYDSHGWVVQGNKAWNNTSCGFSLFAGSSGNAFNANTARGNGAEGFNVDASNSNEFMTNTSDANAIGFWVGNGSSYNAVRENAAHQNGVIDAVDDHSGAGNIWESNSFGTTSGI